MWATCLGLFAAVPAFADPSPPTAVQVARVSTVPGLEELTTAELPAGLATYTLLGEFTQTVPTDGAPASFPTQAYLGYTDAALIIVFRAFDPAPAEVRGRMGRREDIGADDLVTVTLDTEGSRQRGYVFSANPLGIQRDGLWTEGGSGVDYSFDTLWHSQGRRTRYGYVVTMRIPFKSLRFPPREIQSWGIVLERSVARGSGERSAWPHISARIEGVLTQAATITGMADVSAGRNLRLIPYGTYQGHRTRTNDPAGPAWSSDWMNPSAGIDGKFVIRDAIVVDSTVNPDFSQVESDLPQATANSRFEVFFPERRPFFLENANYFETPLNLLFTRRIADPLFGVRSTGTVGAWALGALLIDDRSIRREAVPVSSPGAPRALNAALRVARDIGGQSNVGLMFVGRTQGAFTNYVAGLDTRVRLDDNWSATAQAVGSSSSAGESARSLGYAAHLAIRRQGRQFGYNLVLEDIHPDFQAANGFVPRVGFRRFFQGTHHDFRPEGAVLISHGPRVGVSGLFDREGELLDASFNPSYRVNLTGQTEVGTWYFGQRTRLRSEDYAALPTDRTYDYGAFGFWLNTRLVSFLELDSWHRTGTTLNFSPARGAVPEEVDEASGDIALAVRPGSNVRVSAQWLYQSLRERQTRERVFRNDIVRTRVDWQLTRALSLRVIAQYDVLDANPTHTSIDSRRDLNADVLLTYLTNPWTAVYLGYNSNYRELGSAGGPGTTTGRTDGGLVNDAGRLFLKMSYLIDL